MKISLNVDLIRYKDWRLSFLPLVLGLNFFIILYFDIEFSFEILKVFFLFLITTIGFLSFGYFINEYFDIETDLKAGKKNVLHSSTPLNNVIILLLILGLIFIPWISLKSDFNSWILITFELFCFVLYSSFRLKKEWLLSPILDSLYAYIIPFLLIFNTYHLYSNKEINFYPFILFLISFLFLGLRNILYHQIVDADFDIKSNIVTVPIRLGFKNTTNIIRIFIYGEIFTFLMFNILIIINESKFISYLVFYILHVQIFFHLKKINNFGFVLNEFIQIYFPIISLVLLFISDWKWLTFIPYLFLFTIPLYFKNKGYLIILGEKYIKSIKR